MVLSYIFLFVTVTSIIWKSSLGLTCLSCHSESDRSRCLTHQVECRDGLEDCFFDKSTLQNSAVVYSAGCRAKGVCDLLGNAVGRRDDISRSRRTSVLCAQCCNTAAKNRIPCNAHLCTGRPTCLFCDSEPDITKCLRQKVCQGSGEKCYLDKVILPDLSTVFSAGCRSTQVCDLIASVGKRNVDLPLIRQKKATVVCAQCCNTQPDSSGVPCNKVLCGLHYSSVSYDTCGVCDRVSRSSDCTVFQSCQPTEVCKLNKIFSGGRIIHELGCELKTVCDVMLREYKATHHGKRADLGSLVLCSACCTGKNCNTKGDCRTLIQNQPCFNSTTCG
ncbi:uncharacterized protein [Mytilus edulis]|uniref:uncharacterized protein isoform X2 n=1 Tax=Mytilus edulis TaxID=6550 RepID=UPI0039F0894D